MSHPRLKPLNLDVGLIQGNVVVTLKNLGPIVVDAFIVHLVHLGKTPAGEFTLVANCSESITPRQLFVDRRSDEV
jgi:hypothetical protein